MGYKSEIYENAIVRVEQIDGHVHAQIEHMRTGATYAPLIGKNKTDAFKLAKKFIDCS